MKVIDTSGAKKVKVSSYPGSNAFGNIPFGYYDTYAEEVSNLNPGAGTIELSGTAVPTGEVWTVEHIGGINNTTAPALVELRVIKSGIGFKLYEDRAPVLQRHSIWTGRVTLKAGDYCRVTLHGTVAGDDLYAYFSGYRMKVA